MTTTIDNKLSHCPLWCQYYESSEMEEHLREDDHHAAKPWFIGDFTVQARKSSPGSDRVVVLNDGPGALDVLLEGRPSHSPDHRRGSGRTGRRTGEPVVTPCSQGLEWCLGESGDPHAPTIYHRGVVEVVPGVYLTTHAPQEPEQEVAFPTFVLEAGDELDADELIALISGLTECALQVFRPRVPATA